MELLTEAFASAWKRSVNIDSDKLSVCFQPLLHTLLRFSTTVPRTVPRTDSSRTETVLFMFLSAKWSSAVWMFQIVNITMAALQYREQQSGRRPVDITFTVRGSRGYLTGSDVSNALMRLTVVEFSYYMGFPVLQIAEREDNKKKLRLNECLILALATNPPLSYNGSRWTFPHSFPLSRAEHQPGASLLVAQNRYDLIRC